MAAMVASAMDWGESLVWQRVWGLSLAAWAFIFAGMCAFVGLLWDGAWHASWGRDTFFIPPHDMMYGGITIAAGMAVAVLITSSRRPQDPTMVHVGPLQAPIGIWIALVGMVIMFSSAAYDDWWHNNIGHVEGYLVLWSPPHFLGLWGRRSTGGRLFVCAARSAGCHTNRTASRCGSGSGWICARWDWCCAFAICRSSLALSRWTDMMIYDKMRFDGSLYPLLALFLGTGGLGGGAAGDESWWDCHVYCGARLCVGRAGCLYRAELVCFPESRESADYGDL